jgi:hypothetical protein
MGQELIIEAGRTEKQYWKDIWRYRELFYFLAWRDILVRYKQTIIGIAWALLRPFLTTVVFTLDFVEFIEKKYVEKQLNQSESSGKRIAGLQKGKIWISEDFNEPLELKKIEE